MSSAAIATGLELLIQLIDRVSAASAIVKKAHAQGRPVNSAELSELRSHLDESIESLDEAISQAKAEGR